jgi:hypothetical protein
LIDQQTVREIDSKRKKENSDNFSFFQRNSSKDIHEYLQYDQIRILIHISESS